MPDSLHEVEPGDLIEAELFNQLVRRLRELEKKLDQVPADAVTVPRFIGSSLGTAVDRLNRPNVLLNLGSVYDSHGNALTPTLSENRSRTVVSQMPRPGTNVSKNERVELLIAATSSADGGNGGSEQPGPTIKTVDPNPQHIGSPIMISGDHFGNDPGSVSVTIDGVSVDEIRGLDANSMEVTVPSEVPDPADSGNDRRTVSITVTVGGKTANFDTFAVQPPSEQAVPKIEQIDTLRHNDDGREQGQAYEGDKIVVIGENFASEASKMAVEFIRSGMSNETGTIEAVRQDVDNEGTDELDVTIPTFGANGVQSRTVPDVRLNITDGPNSSTFEGSANPGGAFRVYPSP